MSGFDRFVVTNPRRRDTESLNGEALRNVADKEKATRFPGKWCVLDLKSRTALWPTNSGANRGKENAHDWLPFILL